MSPDKYKKLKKLRKSLDKLDNSFIKLIKKRTSLVDQVLQLKKYKKQIVDKKRIKIILSQIKKKSIKHNIDPKITKKIWSNMISAYIDYERRNFNRK
jgi:chorismate mutase|tara:strand:- start:126 stop:416 length:291 start_codon:yes stop_codon:yes gene_type:complete